MRFYFNRENRWDFYLIPTIHYHHGDEPFIRIGIWHLCLTVNLRSEDMPAQQG